MSPHEMAMSRGTAPCVCCTYLDILNAISCPYARSIDILFEVGLFFFWLFCMALAEAKTCL